MLFLPTILTCTHPPYFAYQVVAAAKDFRYIPYTADKTIGFAKRIY